MVVQSAQQAINNANATKTCDVGMCLWQTQEWMQSPHVYPDATAQWNGAKYKHAGDKNPPLGAPVFWTGGGSGHGHATVCVAQNPTKVRSTDQQTNGKVDTVTLDEIAKDWGNLKYAGWTEDIGNVDIPYLRNGGAPTNPNGVKVGDLVYAVANGGLNARVSPGGATTGTSLPYGSKITVGAITNGWAQAKDSTAQAISAEQRTVTVQATGYLLGIDVSSNNDDTWKSDTTWQYAFVKATEGKSYVNPDYIDQITFVRSKEKGLGHYHWLNNGDVTAQVQWFVKNADVRDGDMIAVDWEDSSNPSTAQKDDAIRQLQAAFPNSKVGLYCNRDWWLNHDTSSFFGDFLWIANYNGGSDPGIQAEWVFWQYTSKPYDKNWGAFADLAALQAWAGSGGPPEPPDPDQGYWYSTDYLFPQVKPDPTNPQQVKAGQTVKVTASGGLTARTLPGGPKTLNSDGSPLVRETGYQFDVTGDLVDGWVTGGTNWYSSDYLDQVEAPPPTPKPGWSSTPLRVLPMKDVPGSVSYLQGCSYVPAMTDSDGKKYGGVWIVAQDYDNKGDIRFLAFDDSGKFLNWFQVNDAGHGQTVYAYRSAAGNLYVWCGEDPAYRYSWQPGKKVSKSSGTKMDYGGARPMNGFGTDRVAFRDASDTKETFSIWDRTDFTDGTNRKTPKKKVTVSKRTNYSQQSWSCNESRIWRIMGSTNESAQGSKTGLHILDVFDWSGKLLLDRFDLTKMHQTGCTEDEPEGLCFSASPGNPLAAKREGPASASKRSYVIWTLTGMP